MHILVCLEGTCYAGKTTVARLLLKKMPAIYGPRVANGWEEQEEEIHKNPNPLARFSFCPILLLYEGDCRKERASKPAA